MGPVKNLTSYLKYEPDSGKIIWLQRPSNRITIGDEAGCLDKSTGYIVVRCFGKLYLAHRLAWFLHYGSWPKDLIDHLDRVRTNNKIKNLREVGSLENARNHSVHSTNSSGHNGVSFCNYYNKWVSYIDVNGSRKNLGYSNTIIDAIKRREAAELKYWGVI